MKICIKTLNSALVICSCAALLVAATADDDVPAEGGERAEDLVALSRALKERVEFVCGRDNLRRAAELQEQLGAEPMLEPHMQQAIIEYLTAEAGPLDEYRHNKDLAGFLSLCSNLVARPCFSTNEAMELEIQLIKTHGFDLTRPEVLSQTDPEAADLVEMTKACSAIALQTNVCYKAYKYYVGEDDQTTFMDKVFGL